MHPFPALMAAALLSLAPLCPASSPPLQGGDAPAATHRPFSAQRSEGGAAIFRLDPAGWSRAVSHAGPIHLANFPLPGAAPIDLELERFEILAPGAALRVVGGDGVERDMPFDPASVVLLRGHAAGYPASRVFFSIAPAGSTARIDLGPGAGRYLMTDRSGSAFTLRDGELAVLAALPGSGSSLPVPRCGIQPPPADAPSIPEYGPADPPDPRGVTPMRGLRQLQLAVDTDYEYYELFNGSPDAAMTYLLQVYGIVSDIYIRDTRARVLLTLARIWTTPGDPYNGPDSGFHGILAQQMAGMPNLPRDAAQLFSGRNDLSAGGVANGIGNICAGALSWAGYAQASFLDPDRPHWTNGDIMVTAHELGHNAGTGHTHDYNLDTCQTGNPPAHRGSIMSYCGQGYSGDDANHDLWFHEHTANLIRVRYTQTNCVTLDCNANGTSDATDISSGASADANANGVPDECEDCNGNGTLDPLEISSGQAADINGNLIPDSCEADCNGNQVPDAYETTLSPATDLNRNRIPDSCEPDCDGDGTADYNEIQANMTLDIDRNLILDECQRCAGAAGPTDAAALDHAWNLYVGTRDNAGIGEFHALTGVRVRPDSATQITGTNDLIITPDRRILVSSGTQNRVALVSREGQHLGTFIAGGSGGLTTPAGMLLTPGGTLLVASRGTNSVLEYNAQTGAFIRPFVAPVAGGLVSPFGLTYGPGGNLFVTSGSNQVFEFNGATGAFVRIFVTAAANGGLNDPKGLLFKPDDGSLLVCSYIGGDVLRYNGQTGAPLGRWNRNGPGTALELENAWCIRLGPDGDIYVSRAHALRSGGEPLHLTNVRIFHFGVRLGNYQRAFISGRDSGLDEPTGFAFMPGDTTDCNRNLLPDSCDIAPGGGSRDRNQNARPDECDCLADWNSSGAVNSTDISAFLTAWLASLNTGTLNGDFNGDEVVNSTDISAFLTAWLDALTGGC